MRYERSVMQKICESVIAAAARRFTTGGLEGREMIRHAKSHFVSSLPDFRIANRFVTVKYSGVTRERPATQLI